MDGFIAIPDTPFVASQIAEQLLEKELIQPNGFSIERIYKWLNSLN
jgi:hypothetical protein